MFSALSEPLIRPPSFHSDIIISRHQRTFLSQLYLAINIISYGHLNVKYAIYLSSVNFQVISHKKFR